MLVYSLLILKDGDYMNDNLFYGFRGNILFPNQTSIFNMGLNNDSSSKNKIFRGFFNRLEIEKKMESQYQNRIYFLIFKNKYNNIIHCQLARKKQFNKRELKDNDIIETEDNDYPYVNVFIELKSQKFLIESNTQVFENYNTCSNVIENILNKNLKDNDIGIELNPINEEQNFWMYINDEIKVFNIEFKLETPNMFDAEDDATNFLKAAEKNVGSNIVNLSFCNKEGNLKPNKNGINSFVKYVSAGGGTWKLRILRPNGKKEKITSKQQSTKINLPITYEELRCKMLNSEQQNIIIDSFNKIETIEKFKEQN